MKIEVAEERHHDVLVLLPIGRIDSNNAGAFESIVMQHINGGERNLIVDFSRLDFISSAGLRVAVLASRALKATAGRIVLCAMRTHIEEVFRISGFERIITIRKTRDAALEALTEPAPPQP